MQYARSFSSDLWLIHAAADRITALGATLIRAVDEDQSCHIVMNDPEGEGFCTAICRLSPGQIKSHLAFGEWIAYYCIEIGDGMNNTVRNGRTAESAFLLRYSLIR